MRALTKHSAMSATAFARGLAAAMDKVRVTGRPLDITKGNQVIVQLYPPKKTGFPVSQLASLIETLPHLEKSEAKRFSKDLKRVRRSLELPGDLWE